MPESDLIQALLDAIAEGDDAACEVVAQALKGKTWLIPALRPLLAAPDLDLRWWSVRTLALIGGHEATRLLIEALHDPDEPTRCAAALGLGEVSATEAIPSLVARLGDDSGWVRGTAGDALAMIGEPAAHALAEALSDPREGVRVRAADALRRILVSRAPAVTPEPIIAQQSIAITALYRALNDPNRLVRHSAYEALNGLGLLETVFVAP